MAIELLGAVSGQRLVGEPSAPWILSLDYLGAMGACGAIFSLPFVPLEPVNQAAALAFEAAGFTCTVCAPGAELRSQVCAAVVSGSPVILLGKGGLREVFLVSGYTENGAALDGWRPGDLAGGTNGKCEMQVRRDWECECTAAVIPGARSGVHEPRLAYERILRHGCEVLRRGKPAYGRWVRSMDAGSAAALKRPDLTPEAAAAALGEIAEARWYAAHYLNDAAESLPEIDAHLYAASVSCEREHEEMWRIEGLTRRKAQRSEIAAALRRAGAAYCSTAIHIEQACRELQALKTVSIG